MVVRLDEELSEFVREMVESGRYGNAEAVVAASLRQMRDRDVKRAEIRRIMLEEASTDLIHLIS